VAWMCEVRERRSEGTGREEGGREGEERRSNRAFPSIPSILKTVRAYVSALRIRGGRRHDDGGGGLGGGTVLEGGGDGREA